MNKKECYENILKHFCGEDCLEYNETSEPLNRWLTDLITSAVSEEQERIINRIEAKEKFHRKKFKEFQEKTNGNVMNGHLIKAETCKEILSLIKE